MPETILAPPFAVPVVTVDYKFVVLPTVKAPLKVVAPVTPKVLLIPTAPLTVKFPFIVELFPAVKVPVVATFPSKVIVYKTLLLFFARIVVFPLL
ncbi:MAG: hypothetical protein IJ880_08905 [Bacilli bacterium]|nr:hypothetical protein [Bacilli bacterium]